MKWRSVILGMVASAAVAAGVVGYGEVEQAHSVPASSVAGGEPGTVIEMPRDRVSGPFPVTRVVDGDTIWIERNGARAKIRLIGLDTPETVDRRKGVQCFGVAASNQAKGLMSGQAVFLEEDPSQASTDKYGRGLAYVWLADGRLVNLSLITEGFAHEYTYDLPYRYRDQFRAAEADARTHQRGLWSPTTCDGDTNGGGR